MWTVKKVKAGQILEKVGRVGFGVRSDGFVLIDKSGKYLSDAKGFVKFDRKYIAQMEADFQNSK